MKIKKRYIIIPIVIAILIVAIGAGIVLLDRISQKKQIEKDEKNYGNNYQKKEMCFIYLIKQMKITLTC